MVSVISGFSALIVAVAPLPSTDTATYALAPELFNVIVASVMTSGSLSGEVELSEQPVINNKAAIDISIVIVNDFIVDRCMVEISVQVTLRTNTPIGLVKRIIIPNESPPLFFFNN